MVFSNPISLPTPFTLLAKYSLRMTGAHATRGRAAR